MGQPQTRIVVVSTKNTGVAIMLTILFGPLGMLYSTIVGAVIMAVLYVFVGLATFGTGLLILWPIAILWAGVAAWGHNRNCGQ